MNQELFKEELSKFKIKLDAKQLQQFEDYYEILYRENQKTNLTAITEKEEVYLKHFYDSIILSLANQKISKDELLICDIGSGAGFPSIPLKIVFPKLKITIVDSLNKRIKFLEGLKNKLGLSDVSLIHSRAEDLGRNKDYREKFDIVTARAVARLNVLVEFCLPLVKIDGYFLAMKSQKANEELLEAKKAITLLGGNLEENLSFKLPKTNDVRQIIVVKKRKQTPKKYPRRPGIPTKIPLI